MFGKVREKISAAKASFSKQQNERSAGRLQKLKTERVKQEGKVRLAKAEMKERTRIQSAKDTRKKVNKDRYQRIAKQFSISDKKGKKKEEKKSGSLGGGLGSGINPAFGLGKGK
jgi:hypothetical protein